MTEKLSRETVESLNHLLEWASYHNFDSILGATAKYMSDNDIQVSQGFKDRSLFFKALALLKRVNYRTVDELSDILIIYDEIENSFKDEYNANFTWNHIRKLIINQLGVFKLREAVHLTDENRNAFEIPTDFDFKEYKKSIPVLAKEYFFKDTDTQEDIDAFVKTFTEGLLIEKNGRRFFSKKMANGLCQANDLRKFRSVVETFLKALQIAVLPIPQLEPIIIHGKVSPLLTLQVPDVPEKEGASPYPNSSSSSKSILRSPIVSKGHSQSSNSSSTPKQNGPTVAVVSGGIKETVVKTEKVTDDEKETLNNNNNSKKRKIEIYDKNDQQNKNSNSSSSAPPAKVAKKPSKVDFDESDIESPSSGNNSEESDDDDDDDTHRNNYDNNNGNKNNHAARRVGISQAKREVLSGLGLTVEAPTSSRTKFSFEEEQALIKGVEEYGKDWTNILNDRRWSKLFRQHHRTNVNLKDKYRNLVKNGVIRG